MIKFQSPIFKSQINPKFQCPNTQTCLVIGNLVIENYLEFGAWILVISGG
jgi:hypothetical protein